MTTKYLFNRENLENILSTALYGSTWAYAYTPKKYRGKYDDFKYREARWAQILLDGGYIIIADIEDDSVKYKLSLEMLQSAWSSENPDAVSAKAHILNGEDDYYDGDTILQCALFQKVVYG